MRKSTIFISAVLTTFALVMLYRVALAYRDNQTATEAVAQSTSTPAPTATEPPAPAAVTLGPEEAAQLAAQVVGNANLLSAESSNFSGADAYMITFTNNDVVYVGLDGEILSVQVAPVVMNIASPVKQKKSNNNSGGGGGGNGGGGESHEDGENHEEHDD